MKRFARKTAPKVVNGRVQNKNRWSNSPNYKGEPRVAIQRRRPGFGYRHVVKQSEVYSFLQIIPNWNRLGRQLNRIILDEGSEHRSGWFHRGEVGICAFPHDLIVGFDKQFFFRDIDFFIRFNVPYHLAGDEEEAEHEVTCEFSTATARYYLLMRTLLHELGHHSDLITNRKRWCTRGEDYAEEFGRKLERQMWSDYCRLFGIPK